MLSLIETKSSAYKISYVTFYFTFSVIASTAIAITTCDNTDSWCAPTCTQSSADNSDPALTLFWFLERRSSPSLFKIDPSLAFVTRGDFIFFRSDVTIHAKDYETGDLVPKDELVK